MFSIRTSTVVALMIAFGLGFSAIANAAGELRTDQLVHHEIRAVI